MKNIFAGLLAGLVLALVFALYVFLRRRALADFFRETDESIACLGEKALFSILLGGFIVVGLAFGALAGLVYGWIGSHIYFTGLALGLALLFSLLALVSKQPLILDKIVWNLAVGGILGLLVPWLAL